MKLKTAKYMLFVFCLLMVVSLVVCSVTKIKLRIYNYKSKIVGKSEFLTPDSKTLDCSNEDRYNKTISAQEVPSWSS